MEHYIMENGTLREINMVEVYNYGQMDQNIQDIGLIIKQIKEEN